MSDRGRRAGVPFYAPPRKTSAEIISEARAAISADMNGPPVVGAGVRPLRTRRPFTPRDPQRPRDALDLKYVSLLENGEESSAVVSAFEQHDDGTLIDNINTKKKATTRPAKTIQGGDGWSGFPKLPHLSGRSKPLHRRNTTEKTIEAPNASWELAQSISVKRPLNTYNESKSSKDQFISEKKNSKKTLNHPPTKITANSLESSNKKKLFLTEKTVSYDSATGPGDVTVRHLAAQLPTATHDDYENMTVLEIAEILSRGSRDVDRTLLQLSSLQKCIERSPPTDSLRELVLRALLTHAHDADDRLLAAVAKALLTMRVTGSHLTVACKLVFKIASDDRNDRLFKDSNLLELVVEGSARACPVRESACVLRAAGALRVLALEPELRRRARAAGAAHLAVLHLKILNDAKAERSRQMTDEATHTLYQLTGALRNLAGNGEEEEEGEEGIAEVFVESGAVGELVKALTLHTDRDVLTNVARCLSVLSACASCLPTLCGSVGASRALVGALCACASRAPLALRLAYTLGNMAADSERARIDIYKEEGSVDVLLTVLELYAQRNDSYFRDPDPDLHLVGSDLGGSDGSNEDVLIKIVRVLANLCLEPVAGQGMAETPQRTVRALLSCLQLAGSGGETETAEKEDKCCIERREELAVAAMAAINNITFYFEPSTSTSHFIILEDLVKATCGCLRVGRRASLEALRALGNLSRCQRAARAAVLHGVLDALPPYYTHEDAEVRSAAAGVLVNVCGAGDAAGGGEGSGAGGVTATQALCAAARARDVAAAALLARALWNAHTHRPLDPSDARRVAAAFTVFMDEDPLFPVYEAKCGDRRASDPEMMKNRVKFELDDNSFYSDINEDYRESKVSVGTYNVEEELYLEQEYDEEEERRPGSDLGFEEGAPAPAWRALVAVAGPLLERLRPARRDASVGTD